MFLSVYILLPALPGIMYKSNYNKTVEPRFLADALGGSIKDLIVRVRPTDRLRNIGLVSLWEFIYANQEALRRVVIQGTEDSGSFGEMVQNFVDVGDFHSSINSEPNTDSPSYRVLPVPLQRAWVLLSTKQIYMCTIMSSGCPLRRARGEHSHKF